MSRGEFSAQAALSAEEQLKLNLLEKLDEASSDYKRKRELVDRIFAPVLEFINKILDETDMGGLLSAKQTEQVMQLIYEFDYELYDEPKLKFRFNVGRFYKDQEFRYAYLTDKVEVSFGNSPDGEIFVSGRKNGFQTDCSGNDIIEEIIVAICEKTPKFAPAVKAIIERDGLPDFTDSCVAQAEMAEIYEKKQEEHRQRIREIEAKVLAAEAGKKKKRFLGFFNT
tara:strand:+ start:113 stop:787 length:675 start_codon:yes stop_codon:yes gene_type:complete